MILHPPFIITARLLAGVQVGGAFLSIKFDGSTSEGRARYRYYIDGPDFEHEANDLKPGVGGGSLVRGMSDLLCFLSAAAESYRYGKCTYTGDPDDNSSLFPEVVTTWAYQNDDEITMLRLEIEESETELIED